MPKRKHLSHSHVRGWQTRRSPEYKSRKFWEKLQAEQLHRFYSDRSRRGWITRRRNEEERGPDSIETGDYFKIWELISSKEVTPGTTVKLNAGDIYHFDGKIQDFVLPYLRVQFDAWSLLNEADESGYWRNAYMWTIKRKWPVNSPRGKRADTALARVEIELNPDYRERIAESMEKGKKERVSFV